jgi:5'-nucleotidase
MSATTIETYTGELFDFATPRPADVRLTDIAHALSMSCRFGGHVDHFYSVAQHALMVVQLVRVAAPLHPHLPELQLAALHHDSHEAYIGDIPTPMKRALAESSEALSIMARDTDRAISEALGIRQEMFQAPEVRQADHLALRIEATALKVNEGRSFAAEARTLPARVPPGVAEIESHAPSLVEREFLMTDAALRVRREEISNDSKEAAYA